MQFLRAIGPKDIRIPTRPRTGVHAQSTVRLSLRRLNKRRDNAPFFVFPSSHSMLIWFYFFPFFFGVKESNGGSCSRYKKKRICFVLTSEPFQPKPLRSFLSLSLSLSFHSIFFFSTLTPYLLPIRTMPIVLHGPNPSVYDTSNRKPHVIIIGAGLAGTHSVKKE